MTILRRRLLLRTKGGPKPVLNLSKKVFFKGSLKSKSVRPSTGSLHFDNFGLRFFFNLPFSFKRKAFSTFPGFSPANWILEFPEAAIDSINSEDPRQEELQPGEESKEASGPTRPKDYRPFWVGWMTVGWYTVWFKKTVGTPIEVRNLQ